MPSYFFIINTEFQILWIAAESGRGGLLANVQRKLCKENLNCKITFIPASRLDTLVADTSNSSALKTAFENSSLIVVSHVILDNEVQAILANLNSIKPTSQILVVSSAPALMRATRLGSFSMEKYIKQKDDQLFEKKPESKIKKILQGLTANKDITPYLKDMMQLAPKLLKLMPTKKAKHIRRYIECYLYMIEQSEENIFSMILMLADNFYTAYLSAFKGKYLPPITYTQEGIYSRNNKDFFLTRQDYLKQYNTKFTDYVGLILLRGSVISGDTQIIDSLIEKLESLGIGVIPAFSGSFDYRVAVENFILPNENSPATAEDLAYSQMPKALISLTGFPLVGGHQQSETELSIKALKKYNLPYFSPVSLLFQSISDWQDSDFGLSPTQAALHVSLPELDGAIESAIIGGIGFTDKSQPEQGFTGIQSVALEQELEIFVRRIKRRIELKNKKNFEKKIAITIFSFPPSKGTVGTAAYLDIFASLLNTLKELKKVGYDVELPQSPEQIIEDIIKSEDKLLTIDNSVLNVAANLEVKDYVLLATKPVIKRVSGQWGNPPGSLNTNGVSLNIYGKFYGKIFVGVQPSFGYEGDPMRLLFAKGATPHHGFLGYYIWLEHIFKADAHLHFGTHGALEFMPGKQIGLSKNCFPAMLIGSAPNFYFYALNNPSEGTIAKRRSSANIISYNTPPLEFAGLYRELNSMKGLIQNYYEAKNDTNKNEKSSEILELILDKTDELNLSSDIGELSIHASSQEQYTFVSRLYDYLCEIETRLIPAGLHTIGKEKSSEEIADLLTAIAYYTRDEIGISALTDIISKTLSLKLERQVSIQASNYAASEEFRLIRKITRTIILNLIQHDLKNTLDNFSEIMFSIIQAETESQTNYFIPLRNIKQNVKKERESITKTLKFLLDVKKKAMMNQEISSLQTALDCGFTEPASGGDPVRNPNCLPSGRNIHGLDPAAVPSPIAIKNAWRVVEIMLAKNLELTGKYPESVGMILWGLDNIKTHGEAIAQAFSLIGVKPLQNNFGRVSRLQVIPLETLGRPRIDVTIEASGIFRDIFGLQIHLLDEAIKLVANLDEPLDKNFVRKRSLEVSKSLGINFDSATSRIFSNSAGAYGTNVEYTVGLSAWQKQEDLADVFTNRKSFIYGKNINGEQAADVLKMLASRIETTFQNLDSSEVGITDVDHYFEYLGGISNLVAVESGAMPLVLVADTTTANAKVRTLAATLRLEVRTKLLNPKWHNAMLRHGYQGVEEIRKRFDYTFGFSATTNTVESWVYEEVFNTFFDEENMSKLMQDKNIHSYNLFAQRLSEAFSRGYWKATQAQLDKLQSLINRIEDRLEGVEF